MIRIGIGYISPPAAERAFHPARLKYRERDGKHDYLRVPVQHCPDEIVVIVVYSRQSAAEIELGDDAHGDRAPDPRRLAVAHLFGKRTDYGGVDGPHTCARAETY